jgi:hypothetical protein
MNKPTSYADVLIAANKESRGEILRRLEAIENPPYGALLAKHILQAAKRDADRQTGPLPSLGENANDRSGPHPWPSEIAKANRLKQPGQDQGKSKGLEHSHDGHSM